MILFIEYKYKLFADKNGYLCGKLSLSMRKSCFILCLFCCFPLWAQQPQVQVSVPLHTIHSGEVTVPLALRYSLGAGWQFQAGPEREDDAGNRVVFTDSSILWPQGRLSLTSGLMEVFDKQENLIKRTSFGRFSDGRLSFLETKGDTTSFTYLPNGIRLRRTGRGNTAYQFDSLDRVASITHYRPDGSWRRQELSYAADTLTVAALDSSGLSEKAVFYGAPKVYRHEVYDAQGQLLRRIRFQYQGDLPAGETLEVFGAGEGGALTASRTLRYAAGGEYPVEESILRSSGEQYRATFTYAEHRPDALLSLTRWDGDRMVDSTRLVYAAFPGQDGYTVLRPSAMLYGAAGVPLDTCIRFVPFDFNGVHTYRSKRVKQFYPDARMSRLTVTRPSIDLEKELTALLLSVGMPFTADGLEGDAFLFDADGAFLSKVQGADGQVLFYQGFGEEPVLATFTDPAHDPSLIDTDCCIQWITPDDLELSMQIVDAHNSQHYGLVKGCRYLLRESGYGGLIDPAVNAQHQVFPKVWYISKTPKEGVLAHNHFNCGNFIWGASAHASGVPLWITVLGSHFNNFFLSPDNKGRLDDKDDILSIRAGYHMLGSSK